MCILTYVSVFYAIKYSSFGRTFTGATRNRSEQYYTKNVSTLENWLLNLTIIFRRRNRDDTRERAFREPGSVPIYRHRIKKIHFFFCLNLTPNNIVLITGETLFAAEIVPLPFRRISKKIFYFLFDQNRIFWVDSPFGRIYIFKIFTLYIHTH